MKGPKYLAQDSLNTAIFLLENRQSLELELLKEQIDHVGESIKPVNLVKSAFKELTSSPDMKNDLLAAVAGISAGYLSKKMMVGNSHNPIKRLMGIFLEAGIAKIVSKNPGPILSVVDHIANLVTKRKFIMNGSGNELGL